MRGAVRLRSFTRPPDNLLRYRVLHFGESPAPVTLSVSAIESASRGFAVIFAGVQSREDAAALTGRELWVPRAELAPPAADEMYWSDLIGFDVFGIAGDVLGRVTGFIETGAQDVMIVAHAGGERMIPFVRGAIVQAVHAGERRIDVDWSAEFDA